MCVNSCQASDRSNDPERGRGRNIQKEVGHMYVKCCQASDRSNNPERGNGRNI